MIFPREGDYRPFYPPQSPRPGRITHKARDDVQVYVPYNLSGAFSHVHAHIVTVRVILAVQGSLYLKDQAV